MELFSELFATVKTGVVGIQFKSDLDPGYCTSALLLPGVVSGFSTLLFFFRVVCTLYFDLILHQRDVLVRPPKAQFSVAGRMCFIFLPRRRVGPVFVTTGSHGCFGLEG